MDEMIKRKSILASLFQLSRTDENYNMQEFLYMMEIGREMGFTEDEIRDIQINAMSIDLIIPSPEHERMIIFYYALFLMNADRQASDNEINFVRQIGFKLGFSEELTEDLIGEVVKNIEGDIDPENMISIIRKHMN